MNQAKPHVMVRRSRGPVTGVVLVLHGGVEKGDAPVRPWRLAYLRMVPIAYGVSRTLRQRGVEVRLLRNRVRGWNAPRYDAVRDAQWALRQIHADHPDIPVVVIGHSMGGRVAFRVAGDPAIVGVLGLAPWTPPREPVDGVREKTVVIVHGLQDRMTDPARSLAFADRARAVASRVSRMEIAGEGHAMLRRRTVWMDVCRAFTAHVLGLEIGGPSFLTDSGRDSQQLRIQL